MNAQKFTQKSLEAVQNAQNLASEYQNMQIEQVHLLAALVQQEDGLIPQLLRKMGKDSDAVATAAMSAVERLPHVTGSGRESGKIYVANDVDRVLSQAEKSADTMKDEYVSVEHLFLSLIENGNDDVRKIFQQFQIDRNTFLTTLQSVRGNTRVTSDSPEDTYEDRKSVV